MLRTSSKRSDSYEELDRKLVYFVRVLIDLKHDPIKSESMCVAKTMADKAIDKKKKAEHIEDVAAIVDCSNYLVIPFGSLQHL